MMQHVRIPIIKMRDILIVSIQMSLSDRLVARLKEDITASITETGARGLVIDLTGIDLMDSYFSKAIRDISMISRLMGAKTVVSGMSPMIAMTLTEMGIDLETVGSALNLDAAIALLDPAATQEDAAIDGVIADMFQETAGKRS